MNCFIIDKRRTTYSPGPVCLKSHENMQTVQLGNPHLSKNLLLSDLIMCKTAAIIYSSCCCSFVCCVQNVCAPVWFPYFCLWMVQLDKMTWLDDSLEFYNKPTSQKLFVATKKVCIFVVLVHKLPRKGPRVRVVLFFSCFLTCDLIYYGSSDPDFQREDDVQNGLKLICHFRTVFPWHERVLQVSVALTLS